MNVEDKAWWFTENENRWALSKALLGGTEAMRAAGEEYLPKFEDETPKSYEDRVKRATLTNFYRAMAKQALGFIFAEQITVNNSKLPKDFLDNVDRRGRDIHKFARAFGLELITRGLHHIFVDHPVRPAGVKTLADEIQKNLRPYFTSISAEAAFAAYSKTENGEERVQHIRWSEAEVSLGSDALTSFDEAVVERVMVLHESKDGVIYRKYERPGGSGTAFVLVEDDAPEEDTNEVPETPEEAPEGEESEAKVPRGFLVNKNGEALKRIPWVTIYAERERFMVARSPLDDVAHLNVEHWQSASDQRNILTVSRYPIQTQIGTEAPVSVTGPHQGLHSKGSSKEHQEVEFGFIEPEGASIQAGERDLADIVKRAEAIGLQLFAAPQKTATGTTVAFTQGTSPLHDLAQAIEDGINEALRHAAVWYGLRPEDAGYVEVSKDFGLTIEEAARLTAIREARRDGDISLETYWEELRASGVFKSGFTNEEEKRRIAKEDEESVARQRAMGFDPDAPPGGGDDPKEDDDEGGESGGGRVGEPRRQAA